MLTGNNPELCQLDVEKQRTVGGVGVGGVQMPWVRGKCCLCKGSLQDNW